MKVLLIEDDEDKREELSLFIKEKLTTEFVIAKSFQSGKKALKDNVFDLILLDMTIPTFDITAVEDGGRSQTFGGRMIMSEMIRKRISTKVIVVTLFDFFGKGDEEISLNELDQQLLKNFPQIYYGAIQFSFRYNGWKEELISKINSIYNK